MIQQTRARVSITKITEGDSDMAKHRFIQLDVFTDQAFAGNPLAVFPEGETISDDDMLKIAR